ncbi:MAG: cardiolipin synthase [Woeseiaceae bacterium]|nr:cardiolipin synthase [Woeseiaceae bacterium]
MNLRRKVVLGLFIIFVALILAGVFSRSRLPTIAPDLARRTGAAVQLEGQHGPLSAAKSKSIIDGLEKRGDDTGIFDRHLALEEAIVGSPLTTGNKVLLLEDGPATFSAMIGAIRKARDHINMETYIVEDDEVGNQFADALIEKQQQGIQVNLIRDSVGTLGTPVAFFQRLTDSGIEVLEFNPVNPLAMRKEWEVYQRDHRKLLIVDGRTAFLGGINISAVYSGGSFSKGSHNQTDDHPTWRDTDLQLTGPVVAELQKLFIETWEGQDGQPLPAKDYFPKPKETGRAVVRAIGSTPDESFSLIYATLLSAIASAETCVYITNAYFVPDPQLLDALEASAGRGVDVTLILPSVTDSWLVFHAGRGYYDRLLRAGVKIYERHGALLHSKTALIDGVWATVGSTNLDWRSFLHNRELNAVVLGQEFGEQLQAMFERDLAQSDAIVLDEWRRRPLTFRAMELYARVWKYWL